MMHYVDLIAFAKAWSKLGPEVTRHVEVVMFGITPTEPVDKDAIREAVMNLPLSDALAATLINDKLREFLGED